MYSLPILSITLFVVAAPGDVDPKDQAFSRAGIQFVNLLTEGRYAEAAKMFDQTMNRVVSLEALEASWAGLIARYGAFDRIGEPTVASLQQYKLVFVPIECTKGRLRVKVVLDQQKKVAGYFWVKPLAKNVSGPPDYLRSDAVVDREVTVGKGTWKLPGTLCLPKSCRVKAGIVFVHGSGPHDRDETIGPNKPFRDLALGLANRGIATLRYDKRTKVHAEKMVALPAVTVQEEVIDDALLALGVLRSQEELAGMPLYVLGHSLGATLAPEIAAADGQVAGIIMLAGGARDFEDTILEQYSYLCSLAPGPESAQKLKDIRRQIEALRKRKLEPGEKVIGGDAAYWYDLCDRDGKAAIQKAASLDCRILVLQGGRDYQSTVEDFKLWQDGLARHPNTTCELFDNLNHLFAAGEGKAVPDEYVEQNHVDPRVIELIARWCRRARVTKRRAAAVIRLPHAEAIGSSMSRS